MQQTDFGLNLSTKSTRKRVFLAQVDCVVPWGNLVSMVSPYTRESKTGRRPFAVPTVLRIHFMQYWSTLSDPVMEESLYNMPLFRDFAGLAHGQRLPAQTTVLRFRHLLEKHKLADQIPATVNELLQSKGLMLKAGTDVDATLVAAPSSTKNKSGERDPDMHRTKNGNQWHFGIRAHIGADAGMVHTVCGAAANVNNVVEGNSLLHWEKTDVFADAGYQGAHKRPDAFEGTAWHVAMQPGKRKALDQTKPNGHPPSKSRRSRSRSRSRTLSA